VNAARAGKHSAAALVALLVPGGLVLVTGAGIFLLLRRARTGDAQLDALAVRGRVVAAVVRVYGVAGAFGDQGTAVLRACMALVNNEWNRRLPLDAQIGDVGAGVGPSVGPMQVSRALAVELGIWTPGADDQADREAYAAKAADLSWCFVAGVRAFKSKLEAAGGDVADAIRRYNGRGVDAAAYRDRALTFIATHFGADQAAA
jgi:hypothetical protein